ncbi:hypothetical protein [Salinarimonas soli]|uniref:Uncharacterized protein n=1 Tax=Salinarimonas soli TaxID=1638099 RepID=A0A5B2VB44_9HYPH|nr:hypothetical protein [Salinarimonas soli]KAA2235855.1 hypothetical protein F0L46_17590 [Salinarimonas soli]
MPRQNRVTPFGTIEASSARGLLMGNRGILHDEAGRLGAARWRHHAWVTCVLSFKERRRPVMAPGAYTELFFCDEAVALAAGHRPCAECRRGDVLRFAEAWRIAHGGDGERPRAPATDRILHRARIGPGREQVRRPMRLSGLPDGAFFRTPERPDAAWLLWRGRIHRWSHAGYAEHLDRPADREIETLTPAPTLRVLAAGYEPLVHPSAEEGAGALARATSGGQP